MKYSEVPIDEGSEQGSTIVIYRPRPTWHVVLLAVAYSLLAVWTAGLYFYAPTCPSIEESTLYSPINEAIEYELVNFNVDPTKPNIYMGSNTKERVDAWHHLTRKGPSKITAQQAANLYEETEEWMGESGTYIVGVEMFHQLHCLDTLRYAIWDPNPYLFHGKEMTGDPHVDHMMHCLEYLRLSMLCLGDTTVIPMVKAGPWYLDQYNGTRKCKKYEPIETWMEDHSVLDTPEFKKWVGSVVDGVSNTSVLLGPEIIE